MLVCRQQGLELVGDCRVLLGFVFKLSPQSRNDSLLLVILLRLLNSQLMHQLPHPPLPVTLYIAHFPSIILLSLNKFPLKLLDSSIAFRHKVLYFFILQITALGQLVG